MESFENLEKQIRELEAAMLRQEVRASASSLSELIDEDFFELGVSGRLWNKQTVIAALKNEVFSERTISDFRLKRLAADVVLAVYRCHRMATENQPAADSLRSSIWKRVRGQWRMVFHQGTPL